MFSSISCEAGKDSGWRDLPFEFRTSSRIIDKVYSPHH